MCQFPTLFQGLYCALQMREIHVINKDGGFPWIYEKFLNVSSCGKSLGIIKYNSVTKLVFAATSSLSVFEGTHVYEN